MRDFPVTAVYVRACYDEQTGRVTLQSQLCMHVRAVMSRQARDFPVTAVHARAMMSMQGAWLSSHICACMCVHDDGEQAGCLTFQSQLCMHVCVVMGSRQGA